MPIKPLHLEKINLSPKLPEIKIARTNEKVAFFKNCNEFKTEKYLKNILNNNMN